MTRKKIRIIGAGVQGLTTAWVLASHGHEVHVRSAESFLDTTSSVAAAFFYPYGIGKFPRHWASISNDCFRSLSHYSNAGIIFRAAQEFVHVDESSKLPEDLWWGKLHGISLTKVNGQTSIAFGDGIGTVSFSGTYRFHTAIIDMPIYLTFIYQSLCELGVAVVCDNEYQTLSETVAGDHDVTINCAGIGNKTLVDRGDLRPTLGQVVRVHAPSVKRLTFLHRGPFEKSPVYIVPRKNDVILGGSFQFTENYSPQDGLPMPVPDLSKIIFKRCQAIEPALSEDEIIESRVGVRPCRNIVRLETEDVGGRPVVHNYGHGGGGVTVSWGCAYDVSGIIESM